jgi:hypothetical protein
MTRELRPVMMTVCEPPRTGTHFKLTVKSDVCWDVQSCTLEERYKYFEGIRSPNLHCINHLLYPDDVMSRFLPQRRYSGK